MSDKKDVKSSKSIQQSVNEALVAQQSTKKSWRSSDGKGTSKENKDKESDDRLRYTIDNYAESFALGTYAGAIDPKQCPDLNLMKLVPKEGTGVKWTISVGRGIPNSREYSGSHAEFTSRCTLPLPDHENPTGNDITVADAIKGKIVLGCLTQDAVETIRMAVLDKSYRPKKIVLFQPHTIATDHNLKVYNAYRAVHNAKHINVVHTSDILPEIEVVSAKELKQCFASSETDYSSALNAYNVIHSKETAETVLWLNSPKWSDPTAFFFPKAPKDRYTDILATMPFSRAVAINRNLWLSDAVKTLPSTLKMYTEFYVDVEQTAEPDTAIYYFQRR